MWRKKSNQEQPVHIPAPIPFVPEQGNETKETSKKAPPKAKETSKKASPKAKETKKAESSMPKGKRKGQAREKPAASPKKPEQDSVKKSIPVKRKSLLQKRSKPPKMRTDQGLDVEDPRLFGNVDPSTVIPSVLSVSPPPPIEKLISGDMETKEDDEWYVEQEEIVEPASVQAHPKPATEPVSSQVPPKPATEPSPQQEYAEPSPVAYSPAPSSEDFDAIEMERQRRVEARKSRSKANKTSKKKFVFPTFDIRQSRREFAHRRAVKRARKREREQAKMEKMLRAAKAEALMEPVEEKSKTQTFLVFRRPPRQPKEDKTFISCPSLDIGSSVLRLYDPASDKFFQRAIPDGIIVNGILVESEEFVEEVKALWRDAGLSRKVRFSVKNGLLQVRAMYFPSSAEGDIEKALEVNAKSIVTPMRPEDTVVDYYELSRSGKELPLLVVAANKSMVSSFREALKEAGLKPVGCSAGPLSAQRALRVPRSPSKTHAIIDIGAETTSFLVASGPDTYFLRILDIGGNDFTRALMQDGIGWGFAEKEKREYGLKNPDPAKRRALRSVSDRLVQELLGTKSDFDASEPGRTKPISGATLLGGGSLLLGLAEQASYLLSLEWSAPIGREQGYDPMFFAGARGVGSEDSISLLPQSQSSMFSSGASKKKQKGRKIDLALVAILVSAVISLLLVWTSVQKNSQSAVLQSEVELAKVVNPESSWPDILRWAKTNPTVVVGAKEGEALLEAEVSGPDQGAKLDVSVARAGIAVNKSRTVKDISRGSWVWRAEVSGE